MMPATAMTFDVVRPLGGQKAARRKVRAIAEARWGRVMSQADQPPEAGLSAFLLHDGKKMKLNPDLTVRDNLELFEKTYGIALPAPSELRVEVVPDDVVGIGIGDGDGRLR